MATTQNSQENRDNNIKTAADLVLKLGVLIWSLIIAVILFPLAKRVSGWLGNRNKLASILVTLIFFAILAVPSLWLVKGFSENWPVTEEMNL